MKRMIKRCRVRTIFRLHDPGGMSQNFQLAREMQDRYLSEPAERGAEQMSKKKTVYENLYTELAGYEKDGVCILIDGRLASPMQVVKAHMAREEGSYMRDYEIDKEGHIESLTFVDINKKKDEQS